jgi:chondroitin AC lyase
MKSPLWPALLAMLAGSAIADDLDTLYTRYNNAFLASTATPKETDVRGFMADLSANGTWPDINLSVTDQVSWTPQNHIKRIASMGKAFITPGGGLTGDASLGAAISKAVDAWIAKDPKSTNWWFNEIGLQQSLGPVTYILKGKLTSAQTSGLDAIMARSWKSSQRTGANLVWISRITVWRAVLNRDESLLKSAVDAIAGTIDMTTGEGVQRDFSFFQHGPQLYSGGYGNAFVGDAASIADEMRGTRYQMSAARLDMLARFILEGQRWMIRGGTMDHSIRGREITRSGGGSAGGIGNAARKLAPLVPARTQDLTEMAEGISAGTAPNVLGNRWFWRSEYMAQQRKAGFISVRMASERLMASEIVNTEGLMSQYLADGATLIYASGKEYDGIFPVWDWCRIPGTTTAHAAAPPAMKNPAKGSGIYAGGVSDGALGGMAIDYSKLGVKARKAWFFSDRGMLALGAGISSTGSDPVQTSVNQCLLDGAVTMASGSVDAPVVKTIAPGAGLPESPLWILHGGFGYVFPKENGATQAGISLSTAKASGSWTRITGSGSSAQVQKDVFSLWIDHGAKPTAAHYQYAVLMGADAQTLSAYAKDPTLVALSNTETLQAAYDKSSATALAAFYAAGTLSVNGQYAMSPGRACMLQVRPGADRLTLTVSDPVHGTADMVVKANIRLEGPGAVWSDAEKATTVTFTLPKGDSAGAAVTRTFTANGVGILHSASAKRFRMPAREISLGAYSGVRFRREKAIARGSAGGMGSGTGDAAADARGRSLAPLR